MAAERNRCDAICWDINKEDFYSGRHLFHQPRLAEFIPSIFNHAHASDFSIMSPLGLYSVPASYADRIAISAGARHKLDVDHSGYIDNEEGLSISKTQTGDVAVVGNIFVVYLLVAEESKAVSSGAIPINLNPTLPYHNKNLNPTLILISDTAMFPVLPFCLPSQPCRFLVVGNSVHNQARLPSTEVDP
jgi:hypothetical protein